MSRKTLIIAHRGVTNNAHENTLAAFETAIRLRADLIECDLRRTRDGHYVIHHDLTVGRKIIGKHALSEIKAEGQALGYEIPTLDELLELISGKKVCLDLELKEQGYEFDVVERTLRRVPPNLLVITSFYPQSINAVKTSFPNLRCGILLSEIPPSHPGIATDGRSRLFSSIRELKADFIAPDWKLLDLEFLQRATENSLRLWVWTVNERSALQMWLNREEIEAVITDELELALALRDSESPTGK